MAEKQVGSPLFAGREGIHLDPDALGQARGIDRGGSVILFHVGMFPSPSLTASKTCTKNFTQEKSVRNVSNVQPEDMACQTGKWRTA
jgi:hypothetical protein